MSLLAWNCSNAQAEFSMLDSIRRLNVRAQDTTVILFKRKQDASLALQLAKAVNYNNAAYTAARTLGIINFDQGLFEEALEAFLQAEVIATEMQDQEKLSVNALSLGQLLLELDDIDAAMIYLTEAQPYFYEENDTAALGKIYTGFGIVMATRGDREKALEYFIRALSLYDQAKYNSLKITPLIRIGSNYLAIGITDLALQYFKRAYDLATTYNIVEQKSLALSKMAQAYIYLDKSELSDSLLQSALDLSREYNLKKIRSVIFKDLAITNEDIGNYKEAIQYFRRYTAMRDSLINDQIRSEVAALQVEYETQRKEAQLLSSQNQIMQLEQRNKISKLWVLIIALGLLSMLVVLYLLRSRFRIQQQLVESDLKAKEMESIALKKELDFKNMDLTNLAIDISRKNEFANEILSKLHGLEKQFTGESSKKIRELIHFTSNHAKLNEDLEKLQLNAEHINQEFFNKLKEQYPELTKNERNLCGLIRLNLSTKEIAAIKNITPKSVEMIRYRLRKKLKLKPRSNVAAFLQSL